jgi:hypothetical protein
MVFEKLRVANRETARVSYSMKYSSAVLAPCRRDSSRSWALRAALVSVNLDLSSRRKRVHVGNPDSRYVV